MKKLVIRKRSLYSFALWIVVGVIIGFASIWLFNNSAKPAVAKPNPNQNAPDTNPIIEFSHTPPIILRSDETAHLEFLFMCGYFTGPGSCHPDATLYAAWGNDAFTPYKLEYADTASIDLPATNSTGGSLRYYVEVSDAKANAASRLPAVGFIEPVVTSSLIDVQVPKAKSVEPNVVLSFPWGSGEAQVGLRPGTEGPTFGPDAMAVAQDGTIGLLDEVNHRVMLFNPATGDLSHFAAPIDGRGSIRLDNAGQVLILDISGTNDPVSQTIMPYLYYFSRTGTQLKKAPVFARLPSKVTEQGLVLDNRDFHTVRPIKDNGAAASRDEQSVTRAKPELAFQGIDTTHALFSDATNDLVFEYSSNKDIGAIALFERVPKGYVVVSQASGNFHIVWFDPKGNILANLSTPGTFPEWVNPDGAVAVAQDGSVYILRLNSKALEILHVER